VFSHLHVHSHFSLGQGASSPEALVAAAAARGFGALACTDTNAVYGAVEFQREAEAAGIRPILGAHLVHGGEEAVVLAEDERGWGGVCRAISAVHWKSDRTDRSGKSDRSDGSDGSVGKRRASDPSVLSDLSDPHGTYRYRRG
jgi:DNA polymerase III alpha subunit